MPGWVEAAEVLRLQQVAQFAEYSWVSQARARKILERILPALTSYVG